MRLAWIAAALLATTGCEKEPSRLDKMPASAEAETGGAGAGGGGGGALEARVARLEKKLANVDKDAMDFLAAAYEQTMERETKAQPGKVYGVDIQPNLQLGQVEGSPQALVTIVEAWDFA
jgi:hypothetical protein